MSVQARTVRCSKLRGLCPCGHDPLGRVPVHTAPKTLPQQPDHLPYSTMGASNPGWLPEHFVDSKLGTIVPWRHVRRSEARRSTGLHRTLPRPLRNRRHEDTALNRDREGIACSPNSDRCFREGHLSTTSRREPPESQHKPIPEEWNTASALMTSSVPRGALKTVRYVLWRSISAQQVNENHQNHNKNPYHDIREL